MNTRGYGGRNITKFAEVFTNDKKLPVFRLEISGFVEKFVTVTPPAVSLRGVVGETIKRSVTIIPEEKYAFKITNARAQNGKHIQLQLQEVQGTGHLQYTLTIENLHQEVGRYADLIILETDSKIQPKINIRVYGDLRKPPVKE